MEAEVKNLEKRVNLSAACYLRTHNHIICDTDWECATGKVDLVTMDDGCLTFVQVNRVNSAENFEIPSVVTPEMRGKYESIAVQYLVTHSDIANVPMRFDIVDVCPLDNDRCMIKHHVNAFGVA